MPQLGFPGIYGFLVVFWGAGIVLFLAKWIDLHDAYLQVSRVAKALHPFLTLSSRGSG